MGYFSRAELVMACTENLKIAILRKPVPLIYGFLEINTVKNIKVNIYYPRNISNS